MRLTCTAFLLSLQSPGGVASIPGENQAASQRGLCLPAVDSSHPAVQQSSSESPQQCHAVWKQSCCLHEAQVVSKQSVECQSLVLQAVLLFDFQVPRMPCCLLEAPGLLMPYGCWSQPEVHCFWHRTRRLYSSVCWRNRGHRHCAGKHTWKQLVILPPGMVSNVLFLSCLKGNQKSTSEQQRCECLPGRWSFF